MKKKDFKSVVAVIALLFYSLLAGASTEDFTLMLLLAVGIIAAVFIYVLVELNRYTNQLNKAKKELPKSCERDGHDSFYYDTQNNDLYIIVYNASNYKIDKVSNFEKSVSYVSYNHYFGVDNKNRKIKSITWDDEALIAKIKTIPFESINGIEIIQDGVSVYKKSDAETLGRAVVGGVALGGVGAVIGGVTGHTIENKHIHSYKVIIYLKDTSDSILEIELVDSKKYGSIDLSTNRQRYEIIKSHGLAIKGVILSIVEQMDGDNKHVENHSQTQNEVNVSIADELRKISELYKDGIISEEEFIELKKKMLTNNIG